MYINLSHDSTVDIVIGKKRGGRAGEGEESSLREGSWEEGRCAESASTACV
jgi:hypothetical protein